MEDERTPATPPPTDPRATVPLERIPLHSTNLLTVLDEDGIIQYESPAIERIYGFSSDELIGEQVTEYFHPADRKTVAEAFDRIVESEGDAVESVEYRHETVDGTHRWVESVASADPMPDGQYVINTRDISERKERERKLQHTNERLQEFAGIVSHDLRSPLAVAQGRLELARAQSGSEHLDAIARAHERIDSLIGDLLTLAQAGSRIAEVEPVDLAALCEASWQTVPTGDATLDIEINRRTDADSSRMKQLLENLIRNAVEHGGNGVAVTVGEIPEGDGFYVADDGPGIPESTRASVFESGYSTGGTGTGLGLAIVTEIAEAHGWEVGIAESSGGGTRVEITDVEFK